MVYFIVLLGFLIELFSFSLKQPNLFLRKQKLNHIKLFQTLTEKVLSRDLGISPTPPCGGDCSAFINFSP